MFMNGKGRGKWEGPAGVDLRAADHCKRPFSARYSAAAKSIPTMQSDITTWPKSLFTKLLTIPRNTSVGRFTPREWITFGAF
jgi:hypothetical protein